MTKPLTITAGDDTLEEIGLPAGSVREDMARGSLDDRLNRWRRVLATLFGEDAVHRGVIAPPQGIGALCL